MQRWDQRMTACGRSSEMSVWAHANQLKHTQKRTHARTTSQITDKGVSSVHFNFSFIHMYRCARLKSCSDWRPPTAMQAGSHQLVADCATILWELKGQNYVVFVCLRLFHFPKHCNRWGEMCGKCFRSLISFLRWCQGHWSDWRYCPRTGVGKRWPGGHLRPGKLFHPAHRNWRNYINSKWVKNSVFQCFESHIYKELNTVEL